MARTEPEYRPLGGKARAMFSVASAATYRLFLGPDHLLYVCNENFAESYKRFYFQDIQALVWSQTSRRRTLNIILLVLSAGTLFLSWVIGTGAGAVAGWSMAAACVAFFGVLMALNIALGPTCVCHVKTAVDQYVVTSLKRVRTARNVFDRIYPLIVAAQGTITLEEAQARAAQPAVRAAYVPPPAAPLPLRHENGRWHAALFSLLLLDGVLTTADFLVRDLTLTALSALVVFVLIGLLITALIRQQHSNVSKLLQNVVWATLVYSALMLGLGYAHFMVASMGDPGLATDQWEWIKRMSEESPMDSPLLAVAYIVSIVGSFVLGIIGWLGLLNHWRATASRSSL